MYIYIIYRYTQIGNRLPRHTECSIISQKQDGCNIHAIKETMCPPAYHSNDFVATLGEFLKVIDHARFKYSINTWEGMTQGREFL